MVSFFDSSIASSLKNLKELLINGFIQEEEYELRIRELLESEDLQNAQSLSSFYPSDYQIRPSPYFEEVRNEEEEEEESFEEEEEEKEQKIGLENSSANFIYDKEEENSLLDYQQIRQQLFDKKNLNKKYPKKPKVSFKLLKRQLQQMNLEKSMREEILDELLFENSPSKNEEILNLKSDIKNYTKQSEFIQKQLKNSKLKQKTFDELEWFHPKSQSRAHRKL